MIRDMSWAVLTRTVAFEGASVIPGIRAAPGSYRNISPGQEKAHNFSGWMTCHTFTGVK